MSITDELRKWVVENVTNVVLTCYPPKHEVRGTRESLLDIADRIDEEHEQQCAESWMRGHDAWAAIDRSDEMAENGWVRLPKDADGEYIHIGDVMEGVDKYDSLKKVMGKVITVSFESDGIVDVAVQSWNSDGKSWHRAYLDPHASVYRHYHAPTVEDVLREMLSKYDELRLGPSAFDPFELMAEYAAKLQLREDA